MINHEESQAPTPASESMWFRCLLAISPILLAFTVPWLTCWLTGPGFTGAVNQGAIVARFLSVLLFLPVSIIPVALALRRAPRPHRGHLALLGFVAWITGNITYIMIISAIP